MVKVDGQSGHLVDGISKRTDEKLALNETVHVAHFYFLKYYSFTIK